MSGKEKRGKRRKTNGEGGGKNDDDDDFLKRIRNENKLTNINSLIVTWRMKKTQLSHTQDTKCKLCRIEINYGFPGKEKKGLRKTFFFLDKPPHLHHHHHHLHPPPFKIYDDTHKIPSVS